MKEIIIKSSFKSEEIVTKEKLASYIGSGNVDVYATPMMIALMENAAMKCLNVFLDGDESSVGTYISSSHLAATPLGMKVYAVSTITGVDGKKVDFKIEAFDECGKIGEAIHSRFIVNTDKFIAKTNSKLDV